MSHEYELLEENVYGDMVAVLVSSNLLPEKSRLWYNRKTSVVVRFYRLFNRLDEYRDELLYDEKAMELAKKIIKENK